MMSTPIEPLDGGTLDGAIEPWRQFTLRDAFVLVGGWCAGFALAAEHRAQNLRENPHRGDGSDVEWLLWGFLLGGVLAAACLLTLQRVVGGRSTRLSWGEGLAFYPLLAFALSTMLLLIFFAASLVLRIEVVFGVAAIALAVMHYGIGALALVLLFRSPPEDACPWTHRLGCWNAILSVVCFLLHTLQRTWIYIEI